MSKLKLISKKEKKVLIGYNHCFMSCALPEETWDEIREAVIGVIQKYSLEATAYQWTMSDDIKTKDLKVLYAKYPDNYENNFIEDLEKATAFSIEIYGDRSRDEFWCNSKEEAKKIVNNKYLRKIKKI